jgi:hypothetical protein
LDVSAPAERQAQKAEQQERHGRWLRNLSAKKYIAGRDIIVNQSIRGARWTANYVQYPECVAIGKLTRSRIE